MRPSPSASTSSRTSPGVAVAEGEQVGGEPPLLAPVAVEVEPVADEPQRPVRGLGVLAAATSGLAASRRTQPAGSGQGSAVRSTGSSDSTAAVSRTVARST